MDLGKQVRRALPPTKRGITSSTRTPQSSLNAGAVDEEMFLKAFRDTPKLSLPSLKDAEQEFRHITTVLPDPKIDWQRRVETLKNFRGLLEAGIMDYKEIADQIKILELPFQECVKDLRSQVVREACITIAFICEKIGLKCSRFCEALLPTLFNAITNSAKVVSSSAMVCIKLLLQRTRAPRLVPIVTNNLNSKSKEIRKACCEFLDLILHTWSTIALEKNCTLLADAIRKGISDADPEARQFARKAFWGFFEHFRDHAELLLNSLDPSKQRVLYTDHPSISNSSSTNSLVQTDSGPQSLTPRTPSNLTPRNYQVSSSSSIENLQRSISSLSGRSRSGIPIFSPSRTLISGCESSPLRSTSAIDVNAARRARARAALSVPHTRSNLISGDNASSRYSYRRTPTSTISSTDRISNYYTPPNLPSSERLCRSRARISQSQPASRSTSPTSRGSSLNESQIMRPSIRRKSGIPLSISRETSPTRSITGYQAMERRLSNTSNRSKPSSSPAYDPKLLYTRTTAADKNLLQSQEVEAAMRSALKSINPPPRYSFEDYSDESETSSICSERSMGGKICINALKNAIITEELSVNQAAIKMLSKIVEKQNKETVEALLPEIMPPLIQAYDNPESAVRKAAVFTMVAIHGRVGEKMKPFINGLNGSKMKLLKLYIDRAKNQQTSGSDMISKGCNSENKPNSEQRSEGQSLI